MRPLLNASLLPKALISLNANAWNSSVEVQNCTCDTDDSSEVPQYVGVGVRWVSEAYMLSRRYSESVKTFRRCEAMFGGVRAYSGCIRSHGPYCGMSYECVEVDSELVLRQDPIILPLTEILTVPVSRTENEPTSRADRDHKTMLKKKLYRFVSHSFIPLPSQTTHPSHPTFRYNVAPPRPPGRSP
jgi:hypothetical protein